MLWKISLGITSMPHQLKEQYEIAFTAHKQHALLSVNIPMPVLIIVITVVYCSWMHVAS